MRVEQHVVFDDVRITTKVFVVTTFFGRSFARRFATHRFNQRFQRRCIALTERNWNIHTHIQARNVKINTTTHTHDTHTQTEEKKRKHNTTHSRQTLRRQPALPTCVQASCREQGTCRTAAWWRAWRRWAPIASTWTTAWWHSPEWQSWTDPGTPATPTPNCYQ